MADMSYITTIRRGMMDSVSANHGNLSSALCKDEGASIT
jgi:hypothetical protein